MSPVVERPVTVAESTVSQTTITSELLTVAFAVCTTDGATRWSIAVQVRPGGTAAARRLAQSIASLAGPSARSLRTPTEWFFSGTGWTERHQALIDLAVELARFGAEGWGHA